MNSKRKQRIATVAVSLVAIAGISALAWFLVTRPDSEEFAPPPVAEGSAPSPQVRSDTAPDVVGVVVPRRAADVASRLGGRLTAIHVSMGERVKKGQVLAELDEGGLRQQIARARAAVARERSGHRRASLELASAQDKTDRRKRLKKFVAEEELANARTNTGLAKADQSAARAGIALAQAELEELETALQESKLVAPFDGVVSVVYASPGSMLKQGMPVVKVNSEELWVRFAGPSEVMERLERGQVVDLFQERKGEPAVVDELERKPDGSASILHLAPEIDTASELVIAEATLTNAEASRLRVGTVVFVGLPL